MVRSQVFILIPAIVLIVIGHVHHAKACRVESNKLKNYIKTKIEKVLDGEALSFIYWRDEPLDSGELGRALGLNVTMAETRFSLNQSGSMNRSKKPMRLIEDLFISCENHRNRQYVVNINLELVNPFKNVEVHFIAGDSTILDGPSVFNLQLPESSFSVQLTQPMGSEECINLNYAQLSSNVEYVIECIRCSDNQQKMLDRIFKKRITHLDAELTTLLSQKLIYGLKILLDQERLELEPYVDQ